VLRRRVPGANEDTAAKPPLSRRRKLLRAALIVVAGGLVLLGGGAAWAYTLPMPKPHPTPQATLIYGDNGQVIGHFSEQDRVDVPLTKVAPVVIDAVVSTEDRHFFTEGAINPTSSARALLSDLHGSGGLQGGSTITQQYVKQAYLSPKRTLTRKFEEAVIAFRVAQSQPKKQILDEYLNTIYWGRGAYGVQAAAQAFFAKNADQLDLPEAALLAGIIKNPGGADPAYDPKLAREYQAASLKAMVRDKKITQAQADAALAKPFPSYVIPPATSGSGSTGAAGSDYFLAAVRSQLYRAYGRQAVDGGGLRVYTTLDPTLQSEAYSTVYGTSASALHPDKGDPSGAVVSIDDQGHVLAMVGGQNYGRSSVNLALGAAGGGTGRQAGSTFKAFMLAAVVQAGYSVNSVIPSPGQITIPDGNGPGAPWKVTNYEGEAPAPALSLVDATAKSVNTVYAQVVEKLGADKLDAMAEEMGIPRSALPHPYLSQVLGTADVSPLDMAAAYSTLASGGNYHSPLLITKVTTTAGKPLPLPGRASSHQVLTASQAAVEDYVLQRVVQGGTGVSAGGIGSPVAGKTGTTENSGDAWFIGYTPKITTAMWMGYADSVRTMDGFRGLTSVTGGTIPAELWHDYMSAALHSEPQYAGAFPPPGSLAGKDLMAANPNSSTTTGPMTTTNSTTSTTAPAATTTTTAPGKKNPKPAPTPTNPPVTPGPAPTTTTTTTTVPQSTTTTTTATATAGSGSGSGGSG
jgi:penicillin-binding protein 1A